MVTWILIRRTSINFSKPAAHRFSKHLSSIRAKHTLSFFFPFLPNRGKKKSSHQNLIFSAIFNVAKNLFRSKVSGQPLASSETRSGRFFSDRKNNPHVLTAFCSHHITLYVSLNKRNKIMDSYVKMVLDDVFALTWKFGKVS